MTDLTTVHRKGTRAGNAKSVAIVVNAAASICRLISDDFSAIHDEYAEVGHATAVSSGSIIANTAAIHNERSFVKDSTSTVICFIFTEVTAIQCECPALFNLHGAATAAKIRNVSADDLPLFAQGI